MKYIINFENFLNENYTIKLNIGDNTNLGIIDDETETQFFINGTWYHKSLVKPNNGEVIIPIKKSKKSNGRYEFDYSCISPRSLEELEAIIEDFSVNDREVKCEEFISHTNLKLKDINNGLSSGSGVFYSNLNFLKNDWNIRYYIGEFYYDADSEYNKEECEENGAIYRAENYGTLLQYACIVNSAIEHVWKKQ
jgi:hypothetical protein